MEEKGENSHIICGVAHPHLHGLGMTGEGGYWGPLTALHCTQSSLKEVRRALRVTPASPDATRIGCV